MKLAVISDTHYIQDPRATVGNRRGGWANIVLTRAVHRLNRHIQPDAVAILGDLVNDGNAADAESLFAEVRAILDRLTMPWFVLPGNHDGDPEIFYRHFPRPEPTLDVAGVRFLCFVDPEEPGYNARRRSVDLARLSAARAGGWSGPVVALQHVPVFSPGTHDCPYNYRNAEDILEHCRRAGIGLTVSGHYHPGIDLLPGNGVSTVVAPALCEEPFSYLLVDIDGDAVQVHRQNLAMPPAAALVDCHCHTALAYCNENMEIGLTRDLGQAFGLADVKITEHSGHLYFSRSDYGPICCEGGIDSAREEDCRMSEYLRALAENQVPPTSRGIEIDCDYHGNPLIRPDALAALPFHVGAVHYLPGLRRPDCTDDMAAAIFLDVLTTFLQRQHCHVLAHPFRVFRRSGRPLPEKLFQPVVALLKQHGVAAELNFHTNEPPEAFVRLCLEAGVSLCLGSDAHNLYEVGEFFPHLRLLAQCGVGPGDLHDVLGFHDPVRPD